MTVYVKTDNGGTLNMRPAPQKNSMPILMQIPNNTKLEAPDGLGNEWTKIEYKNTIGYVMTKYLATSNKDITKAEIQRIYDSLQETLKTIEGVLK